MRLPSRPASSLAGYADPHLAGSHGWHLPADHALNPVGSGKARLGDVKQVRQRCAANKGDWQGRLSGWR